MHSCYITNFPSIGSLRISSDGFYITGVTVLPIQKSDSALDGAPEVVQKCVSELKEYFAGRRKQFSVPLRQEGTSFRKSVWEELEKIPYGETVSYLEIAKRIHNPKAVRAVGSANGKNNICILVPCHRVINESGALGGYACGLEMKQYLLDLKKQNK